MDDVADTRPDWPSRGGLDRYISTGRLPESSRVDERLREAHSRFASDRTGAVSDVYPALGAVDPDRFGLALVDVHGDTKVAGDALTPFTIMSVAKPFVYALIALELGSDQARDQIGVNATGLPFNSAEAIRRFDNGRTNPMVNAGAIATTSLVPGSDLEEQWRWLKAGLDAFAGHELELDDQVLASALATNHRNRELAAVLDEAGLLACDPIRATILYTRQSCLRVNAVDLAVMGATLADGGLNPISGASVADIASCRSALVTMATAGLYETSGDWLHDVGLPGKSGIGGGIVVVSPGKGALGAFSPPLDSAGNSVRGQKAAAFLSVVLGLDMFASAPVPLPVQFGSGSTSSRAR